MNVVWRLVKSETLEKTSADALLCIESLEKKAVSPSFKGLLARWMQSIRPKKIKSFHFAEVQGAQALGFSSDYCAGLWVQNEAVNWSQALSPLSSRHSWLRKGHLLVVLPTEGLSSASLQRLLIALIDTFESYAVRGHQSSSAIKQITLAVFQKKHIQSAVSTLALSMARGISLTKEWANKPANHATPKALAKAAKALEKESKHLKVKVLGKKEIQRIGMNAFLAVAQGSSQEPQFITLEYKPALASKKPPVVLIGKGVTFDSGGISLKPSAAMDEMKFDMSGAASVLGVFKALTQLQLPISVVGLIPCCENMPSGAAVKPGDVITAMNGMTIEVLNTDAEGRLLLCDTLTYAQRYRPQVMIDVATLTGACVVALGDVRSGLFSSDLQLSQALFEAGEASGDLCWPMPLDAAYGASLKSNFADVPNIGSANRSAGAVVAAKFLEKFVPAEVSWAHLDIAGTAWKSGAQKGATGRPVSLLMQYLLNQAPKK